MVDFLYVLGNFKQKIFYISKCNFFYILQHGESSRNETDVQKFLSVYRYYHSDLQYSEDIAKFLANFLRRIVKKTAQKLILGFNFINKNSDDFYVL